MVRDNEEGLFDAEGRHVDEKEALIAHDKALRAEIAALREQIETILNEPSYKEIKSRADKAEAARDRLRTLLAEAAANIEACLPFIPKWEPSDVARPSILKRIDAALRGADEGAPQAAGGKP